MLVSKIILNRSLFPEISVEKLSTAHKNSLKLTKFSKSGFLRSKVLDMKSGI